MEQSAEAPILVAGAGPAGMICSLALTRAGFRVLLVGPAARAEDRRTTALMMPSLRYLGELGISGALASQAAPLRTMRIVDGTKRLIRSRPVTFRADEIGEEAFGYNIPNSVLNGELDRCVDEQRAIERRPLLATAWRPEGDAVAAVLEDGSVVTGKLAVAADGRNSPAREAAGISILRRSYPQAALVLNFAHDRDHAFTSTEFHTESGPFTQVPLPGHRSSLVWVLPPETAELHAALGDEELSVLVEEKMQSMLGRVRVEPGRQVYPLSAAQPASFARNRIALVGEAAHVFPPIGAQGLNLGIRDVRDLVAVASAHRADPGAPRALATYSARRRPDILARSGAVNALNASLLSDFLPAQVLRSLGLGALSAFAPLRAFFMREGLSPGSGFSDAFSAFRKQVRR